MSERQISIFIIINTIIIFKYQYHNITSTLMVVKMTESQLILTV